MRTLGLICAVVMPLFNIPLILRIIRRKSSEDISLVWVVGVWVCIIGMLPSGLRSPDRMMVAFSVVNFFFFTAVLITVLLYHPGWRRK